MLLGRKKSRSVSRLYTTGELNRTADALLHPLAKLDPAFPVLDGAIDFIIEGDPPESLMKFIQQNLPELIVAQRMRRSNESMHH